MELNKIGKDLVLELLNRDNNKNYNFNHIVFGVPKALPVSPDYRNTEVKVTAKLGGPYRGEEYITYWRLHLDEVLVGTNTEIMAEGITNTLELLDILNKRYNLKLSPEDVVIEAIDTTILPKKYMLRTKLDSYAYIGQVELSLIDSKLELKEVLPINFLPNGFYPSKTEMTLGGLSFLTSNGKLLSAPKFTGSNAYQCNNGELEIYAGIHIQDPTYEILPVDGTYEFVLDPLYTWELDVGFGLLSSERGVDVLALYELSANIAYADGGSVDMAVVTDSNNDVGWSILGSLPSIDFLYARGREVLADSIDLGWLKDIVRHAVANQAGSLYGTWTIRIEAKPIKSIGLKPLALEITIKAQQ